MVASDSGSRSSLMENIVAINYAGVSRAFVLGLGRKFGRSARARVPHFPPLPVPVPVPLPLPLRAPALTSPGPVFAYVQDI